MHSILNFDCYDNRKVKLSNYLPKKSVAGFENNLAQMIHR